MIIRKGMRADECDFLRLAQTGATFMDGVRLEMTAEGELILMYFGQRFTKEEINDFENRSLFFHVTTVEDAPPTILLSGAMEVELNFNPCLYKDERFLKFLFEKEEMTVSCIMVDTQSKKVVGLRHMYLDKATKSGFNLIWEHLYVLQLPPELFLQMFSKLYHYSLTSLLQKSKKFGTDMKSRSCKELDIPEISIREELNNRLA